MEKVALPLPFDLALSVVSHGQIGLISQLLQDIETHCHGLALEVILTLNIPEAVQLDFKEYSYPVRVISNTVPKGFGANHNQAFQSAQSHYFCILNPDIRLHTNPFTELVALLKDPAIGVVAPLVLSPQAVIEDSARHFPTLKKIAEKLIRRKWSSDYVLNLKPVDVDWVAGMFMVFPHAVFDQIHGFNDRYFLYYEDVDICARLHLTGLRVVVCPGAKVVHDAQRTSHRNFKYLRWHLHSMLRFLTSTESRQIQRLKRSKLVKR